MAHRSRDYYQKPENKEKHSETVKNTMQPIKKRLINISRRREKEIKIKSVVSKFESMDIEVLAKILIEARKTKLLEIQE